MNVYAFMKEPTKKKHTLPWEEVLATPVMSKRELLAETGSDNLSL